MGRENPNYKSLKQFKQDAIKFLELLEFYIDMNVNVKSELFFASTLSDKFNLNGMRGVKKYPLFLGQMSVLYKFDPLRYEGVLNDALFDFLAFNFRNNVIFVVNEEGFLLYILVMRITRQQLVMINTFFSEHVDDLSKFQYVSREYNPEIEPFKLLSVNLIPGVKLDDVAITYF